MKQIELKVVPTEAGVLDYRKLILEISRTHPHGITIPEMEKAVRVIARARDANGILLLEDADWETLKTYIQGYPFAYASKELLQFSKDISGAPEAELETKAQ